MRNVNRERNAQMIRTASGQILCVYRHVGYPEGYRGVLSDDEVSNSPSPVFDGSLNLEYARTT